MKKDASLAWPVAGISGAVVVLCVLAATMVRLPKLPGLEGDRSRKRPSEVWLTKMNSAKPDRVSEELELRESVSLYWPTARNTSVFEELPKGMLRDPGALYRAYPARYVNPETSFDLKFPETEPTLERPVDVLSFGKTASALTELGQRDVAIPPLTERAACIEARDTKTGNMGYRREISKPEGSNFPNGEWQPLEIMINVDTLGLVGTPTIVTGGGSGSDEVDAFFCNYLATRLRIGERLRPGVYSVTVGP